MPCPQYVPIKEGGLGRCKSCGMPQAGHVEVVVAPASSVKGGGKKEDEGILSFTHEEFIAAQLMVGQTPAVTPATLRAAAGRDQRVLGAASECRGRIEEQQREAEEATAEHEVRVKVKAAIAAAPPPPVVEPRPASAAVPEWVTTFIAPVIPPATTGGPATAHVVSLHWVGPVDLDLSCVGLDASGLLDFVFYFGSGDPTRGHLQHSGDMLRGPLPNGAVESIIVDSGRLKPSVAFLYFVVSSFNAATLGDAASIAVTVRAGDHDAVTPKDPVWTTTLDTATDAVRRSFAYIACRMRRTSSQEGTTTSQGGGWVVESAADHVHERMFTARSLVRPVQQHFDRTAGAKE